MNALSLTRSVPLYFQIAVGYRLDKTELNFSHMEMETTEMQSVTLSNTG